MTENIDQVNAGELMMDYIEESLSRNDNTSIEIIPMIDEDAKLDEDFVYAKINEIKSMQNDATLTDRDKRDLDINLRRLEKWLMSQHAFIQKAVDHHRYHRYVKDADRIEREYIVGNSDLPVYTSSEQARADLEELQVERGKIFMSSAFDAHEARRVVLYGGSFAGMARNHGEATGKIHVLDAQIAHAKEAFSRLHVQEIKAK